MKHVAGIFDKVAAGEGTSALDADVDVDVEVEGAWGDEDLGLEDGLCRVLYLLSWFF